QVEHASFEREQLAADIGAIVWPPLAQHRHARVAQRGATLVAEARAACMAHQHVARDEVAQALARGALAEIVLLAVPLREGGLVEQADRIDRAAPDVEAEAVAG